MRGVSILRGLNIELIVEKMFFLVKGCFFSFILNCRVLDFIYYWILRVRLIGRVFLVIFRFWRFFE